MREEQFIELPSQGSIYSVTRLGTTLILGSGSHGKVFSYNSKGALEEISLPDLPHDIEVIAVDAFQDVFPVLAVTFVQKSGIGVDLDDKPKAGLHIYSTWAQPESPTYASSSPDEFNSKGFKSRAKDVIDSSQLDLIGQQSKAFRLDFIPYDLFHAPVKQVTNSYGHVLLLTGSDRRVHAFEAENDKGSFSEVSVEKYFPEMADKFNSVVTRVQTESLNERTRRISLCGCEDGSLHIWIVSSKFPIRLSASREDSQDEEEDYTIEKIEHNYEGMITSIQFYTDGFMFNVVAASACSPTFIYTNTIEDRFTSGIPLKFSSRWDAVEAVCVADIDLDGRAEIILGTFGCTMLVYKYMDEIKPQWVIVAHKNFSSCVLSIEFINYKLNVVTAKGIHIIEYSTSAYFHKLGNTISSSIPEEITRSPKNESDEENQE